MNGYPTWSGMYLAVVDGTERGKMRALALVVLTVAFALSAHGQITGTRNPSTKVTGGCSSPSPYPCLRTDLGEQQPPSAPNVGGLIGAGSKACDQTLLLVPCGGPVGRILRITDARTDPRRPNVMYDVDNGGSSENQHAGLDGATGGTILLAVGADGGWGPYLFAFNPATFTATRLYRTATNSPTVCETGLGTYAAHGGFYLAGCPYAFSRSNPNWLYVLADGKHLYKYDFTVQTGQAPTPSLVVDLSLHPKCTPGATRWTELSVSENDSAFVWSSAWQQDSAVSWVEVWKPGSGCRQLALSSTAHGVVTGEWGPEGEWGSTAQGTLHNSRLALDGRHVVVTMNGTRLPIPQVWDSAALTVAAPTIGWGHRASGYEHLSQFPQDAYPKPYAGIYSLATAALTALQLDRDHLPAGFVFPDAHPSWMNADPGDTLPVSYIFQQQGGAITSAWINEITEIAADGSQTVWRGVHTFNSGTASGIFSLLYSIHTAFPDGRYIMWESDWMGSIGCSTGASSANCAASNRRGDVFLVQLG